MDQGLEFTRIPAVDGWDIGIDLQEKLLKKSCGLLPIGPGEMGCFLSHRKAWKEILDQDEDWAFVSEDDVHFCGASEFFRNSRWIPAHAMLIKAETARQRVRLDTTVIARRFGHELRSLQSYHGGSAGYFVSSFGARVLLRQTTDRCDPLDHLLFSKDFGLFDQVNILQLDPAICVQDYLVRTKCRYLQSTLDEDRKESRKTQGMHGKLGGLAKIQRELSRSFIRISQFTFSKLLTILGIRIIKKIGYTGDSQP